VQAVRDCQELTGACAQAAFYPLQPLIVLMTVCQYHWQWLRPACGLHVVVSAGYTTSFG
jgi:hypothetical protein